MRPCTEGCVLKPKLSQNLHVRRVTVTLIAICLLPWVLPPASAAVTAGNTVALPAPEQRIRDNSSAIPLFGFSMDSDAGDSLDNITVTFGGTTLYAGDNRTLYTLSTDAAVSGVGLYRDDGTIDDVLDPTDSPITADSAFWSGATVRLVMTSHNEPLTTSTVGNYSWFIIMRTAANGNWLTDLNSVYAQLGAGAIVATDGAGFSTEPASTVSTANMFVRQTRAFNLVNGTTNYIGQGSVAVHERAPLGLRIVDGRDDAAAGINDGLTQIDLRLNQIGGSINSFDFAPIGVDGTTSGLAVYRDDGAVDDALDANDTAITLGSISPVIFPVGGVNFHLTFSPPEAIPHDVSGNAHFLFVIRTGMIVTNDALRLTVVLNSAHTNGILPSDQGRWTNTWTNSSSGTVYGDNTPPSLNDLYWSAMSSGYVTTNGDRLWFNHRMPAPVTGTANAQISDGNSGLDRVLWSPEAGPMSGPNPLTNSFGSGVYATTTQATFDFDASSSDSSSPVDVAVFDVVGNAVTALAGGWNLSYTHTEDDLVVDPLPGWYSTSGGGVYIDSNGTLWFSNRISGSSWGWIAATATSLYGGGLSQISASHEANLGMLDEESNSYSPGTVSATFYTGYEILANSTQGNGTVKLTATDQSATSMTRSFPLREDTTGPAITILAPADHSSVNDIVRFRARITDAGAGVSGAWIEQLPDGYDYSMFKTADDEWFVDFDTPHIIDGPNRFTVYATDNVGNEASASVELVVRNSDIDAVGPSVALVSPLSGQFLAGATTLQVAASDGSGVSSVWMRVGQGTWTAMTFNAATGYYESAWNTTDAADGTYEVTVMAKDIWDNAASTDPVSFTVDNHGPVVSVTGPVADQTVLGTYSVRIFTSDSNGVRSVTVTVGGKTIDVAYNPSTGYYEYTVDTRAWADGTYSLTATATDESGKTTTSSTVPFKVKNTVDADAYRTVRESANFMLLLFIVLAFAVTLLLAKRGTLGRWMGDGGGGGGGGGGSGGERGTSGGKGAMTDSTGSAASSKKDDEKDKPKSD